jgi:hypothetical protein
LAYLVADPRHGREHDADGEQREADREGGPQDGLTPVPGSLRLPRAVRLGPVGSRGGVPVPKRMPAPGQGRIPAPHQVGQHAHGGGHAEGQPEPAGPGVSRTRPDLVADLLQAVRARLHLFRGGMQGMAHELGELTPLPVVRAVTGSHHHSRSNAERRAVMPLAV